MMEGNKTKISFETGPYLDSDWDLVGRLGLRVWVSLVKGAPDGTWTWSQQLAERRLLNCLSGLVWQVGSVFYQLSMRMTGDRQNKEKKNRAAARLKIDGWLTDRKSTGNSKTGIWRVTDRLRRGKTCGKWRLQARLNRQDRREYVWLTDQIISGRQQDGKLMDERRTKNQRVAARPEFEGWLTDVDVTSTVMTKIEKK